MQLRQRIGDEASLITFIRPSLDIRPSNRSPPGYSATVIPPCLMRTDSMPSALKAGKSGQIGITAIVRRHERTA